MHQNESLKWKNKTILILIKNVLDLLGWDTARAVFAEHPERFLEFQLSVLLDSAGHQVTELLQEKRKTEDATSQDFSQYLLENQRIPTHRQFY